MQTLKEAILRLEPRLDLLHDCLGFGRLAEVMVTSDGYFLGRAWDEIGFDPFLGHPSPAAIARTRALFRGLSADRKTTHSATLHAPYPARSPRAPLRQPRHLGTKDEQRRRTKMPENETPLPTLPCPNCKANLLEKGLYNYCSETVSLREDNYAYVRDGCIYVDHDEGDHETQDHECQLDAYCRECDTLLPWALYELRDLDGLKLTEAPKALAEFLEKTEE